MTTLGPYLAWGARLLGAVLVGWLVVVAYRGIRRISTRAGALVAAGIVIRAAIAAGLFFVSYLDLAPLRGLHTGDGFWSLAPDAREYFGMASGDAGPGVDPEAGSSPAFIRALSLWMQVVGVSPAAGAFLNLCCYLAIAWIIVRVLRRHEPVALAAVAAFTFSPALLVFGSQSLKDIVFILLLVAVCGGAWVLLRERPGGGRQLVRDLGVALLVSVALSLIGGIRGYAAVFVGLAFALAVATNVLWPRRPGLWRRLGYGVLLLVLVNAPWVSARSGQVVARARVSDAAVAEARGTDVETVARETSLVDRLARPFDIMRFGFTRSGGNTNLGGELAAVGLGGRLTALGYGLLLELVPFSLLAWAGIVPAVGKRAFIAIADLDTIFMDCTFAVLAWIVIRAARRQGLNTVYAVFAGALGLALTFALAYVVTNYGTLFRLRLMAASSLWMLALAVRRRTGGRDA